jgi:hypothetical protein
VVLDVHGKMPLSPAQRDPLRYRPTRQRAVPLEPEVVVEPPGGVPLDDEPKPFVAFARTSEGLGRAAAAALVLILSKAHLWIVASIATLSLPIGWNSDDFPAQEHFRHRG